MSDYDDRDYEVGKGKPPKETRWKKGQSGNPKGRPPAKRDARTMSMSQLLLEMANEKMTIVKNGKQVSLTKKEVILLASVNDGITATPGHRLRLLNAYEKIGVFNIVERPRGPTDEERRKFLERLAQEANDFDPDYQPWND